MKETLSLDLKGRTMWKNRKEEKKTGRGASKCGQMDNVVLDSFRVGEAESFPQGKALQPNEWASGAGERLPAGPVDLESGGPCEVGSMAESSKGGSIGLEGHLAEDS